MRNSIAYVVVLTIGLFVAFHAKVEAQSQVSIGVLTCTGGEGVGLILGSKKSYACSFAPANGGAPENYHATITKIGLDIGITGKTMIVWTVLASSEPSAPGVLVGNFVGASADVALGIGGGAKVLVGGSSKSIVLQPFSIQGQTGLNLAAGIAAMTLR